MVKHDSLYLSVCLYEFGGSSLPYDLSSLENLRRVVEFHFLQLFSYCGAGSDDFQAPYMLDEKPEAYYPFQLRPPKLSPDIAKCPLEKIQKSPSLVNDCYYIM